LDFWTLAREVALCTKRGLNRAAVARRPTAGRVKREMASVNQLFLLTVAANLRQFVRASAENH